MPNRLARESSPYLQQHARNPVDWYPWGSEALERAKAENKPVFLSVGYSACHWCHVMERESFEDPEIAQILNTRFLPIKVDREERPDIDAVYMKAVVSLTGQGGWPLSVWLTPRGLPFYGGSYFPPSPRFGMPSFKQVLEAVSDTWRTREAEVRESAERLTATLAGDEAPAPPPGLRTTPAGPSDARALLAITAQAAETLTRTLDRENGGWGTAPKFPQPMVIDFLLHRYALRADTTALEAALHSLGSLAAGGIYDHLGGGFHRYSTDEQWTVPHFEKMLYDNALLARAYLHAFQLTGDQEWRRVVEEIIAFVLEEMHHPDGAFYSTLDADSEGEEGRYYLWDWEELQQLSEGRRAGGAPISQASGGTAGGGEADRAGGGFPGDMEIFTSVYNLSPQGNFQERNVIRLPGRLDGALERVAAARGVSAAEVSRAVNNARARLRAARAARARPGRAEKILSSWNGLMLAALAQASAALDRPDYLEAARRNAHFLLTQMRQADGRLSHSRLQGPPRPEAFLEDYAFVIDGLLALYEADFDERWFLAARDLADQMLSRFSAPQGGFFDTPHDQERLITRPRELQDNALPCGNSAAATVLPRLAALAADERYRAAAEATLQAVGELPAAYPTAFGQWLIALELAAEPPAELAIVGAAEEEGTQHLLATARARFRPSLVTALGRRGQATRVPLLAGREPSAPGGAEAWLCRSFTCQQPVSEAEQLERQLAQIGSEAQPAARGE